MPGKTCSYQDCEAGIPPWFSLCRSHNEAKTKGEIDECPGCRQYKPIHYPLCRQCNTRGKSYTSDLDDSARASVNDRAARRKTVVREAPQATRQTAYRVESNPVWTNADNTMGANLFYVYILKLSDATFYAGHTREIRERISEHRDGKTTATAGKNPKLVWFTTTPTREEAATLEAELKEIITNNEREIRRKITWFRDLLREVDQTA